MGDAKQLLEVAGRSMVRRATEVAVEIGVGPVVVVLGAAAGEIERELTGLPVAVIHNPEWQRGLATSLRAGLVGLEFSGELAGVLVTLADQPRVDVAALGRLVAAFRAGDSDAVASSYRGVTGVPAVFSATWLPRLRVLEGDRGAIGLLREHRARIAVVDLPEAADDVDTPDDLERVRALLQPASASDIAGRIAAPDPPPYIE
jgi:molybdenum cofactor cytidylyltransferase